MSPESKPQFGGWEKVLTQFLSTCEQLKATCAELSNRVAIQNDYIAQQERHIAKLEAEIGQTRTTLDRIGMENAETNQAARQLLQTLRNTGRGDFRR